MCSEPFIANSFYWYMHSFNISMSDMKFKVKPAENLTFSYLAELMNFFFRYTYFLLW